MLVPIAVSEPIEFHDEMEGLHDEIEGLHDEIEELHDEIERNHDEIAGYYHQSFGQSLLQKHIVQAVPLTRGDAYWPIN